jgi:NAD(P)H-dependent flavin oxidoreductase YrpB (nitropropane dioxygenase family)
MAPDEFAAAYGMSRPFVGAGMAMVSTPELVAEVANCGGMAQIAPGPQPPHALRAMIRDVRSRTPYSFAVNLICETIAFGPASTFAHVETCIEEGVRVVVFFWNAPPQAWFTALREAGVRVWATVGSAREAAAVAPWRPDALIAQGCEAGGHVRGREGLAALLPSVRRAAPDIPLIAAGGVGSRAQAEIALQLGASAVCVGTRLVATHESAAHEEYKQRLVRACAAGTCVTTLFGPEWPGAPMRVLRNRAVRRAEGAHEASPVAPIGRTHVFGMDYDMPVASAILPTIHTQGDLEEMCLAAGESVNHVNGVVSVREVIEEIAPL